MSNKNEIHRAYELGQSFWLDFIRRDLIEDGELAGLIQADEIRGVTSNPSIFKKAIGESDLYLTAMRPLAHAGWSAERIFESLAVDDIRAATDLFLPLYEGTDGGDGYVSIEVNPELAADTNKTLEETRRLWEEINRPNLMVKIPATVEGVPAIEQAISEGININVTLIFSLERYSEVMDAYLKGLESRSAVGEPVDRVASVASFFVSRVDSAVDRELETIVRGEGPGAERAHALQGKAAVANAKMAYAQFKSVFESPRFDRLRESGARQQRPLWASTSTKNEAYSDVLYVDELIGQYTVNTLPPKTLDAFRDHGTSKASLEAGLSDARAQLEALASLGISLDEITLDLERDGVRAFADAYTDLIETVERRAMGMRDELGASSPEVGRNIEQLDADRVAPRFWMVDPDLWAETKGGPIIKMRLEWLDSEMGTHLDEVKRAARRASSESMQQIGWIGGGEALKALKEAVGGDRSVVWLGTLDPKELRSFTRQTPVDSSLFVVESRAMDDPATMAKLAGVWRRAQNRVGTTAGQQFIVLAPDGSQLDLWASEQNIERLAEWNQSSLTPVSAAGFLLAVLLGADPAELVEGVSRMKDVASPGTTAARNPGLYLGAVLATVGAPISLVADPVITASADWLASFVRARVKLPIQSGDPQIQDGVLVYLRLDGELEEELRARGVPLVILQTEPGLAGLGLEAVRWEVGVGVAAHLLNDSSYAGAPQLPASERLAKMVNRYQKKGGFGYPKPNWDADYASIWWTHGRDEAADLTTAAMMALDRLRPGEPLFVGLYQASSRSTLGALSALRDDLLKTRGSMLVSEFGRLPEAKLSDGFSLLIACGPAQDSEVPELGATYGELQLASMVADLEQLKDAGREACGIHLKTPESNAAFLRALIKQTEISADPAGIRMIEDGR